VGGPCDRAAAGILLAAFDGDQEAMGVLISTLGAQDTAAVITALACMSVMMAERLGHRGTARAMVARYALQHAGER
jgi:hypothetical protein